MNLGNAIAGKHPQLSSHGAMHVPTRAQVLASNTPSAFAGLSVCLCVCLYPSLSSCLCLSGVSWLLSSNLSWPKSTPYTLHAF